MKANTFPVPGSQFPVEMKPEEIARAVAKVQTWRRNPEGVAKPTSEEMALYDRFAGMANLEYAELGEMAKIKEQRGPAVSAGGGGMWTPPAVTLANIFG